MARCRHCVQSFPTVLDPDGGYICCTGCGRVVDEDIYSNEVTFIKGAGGQSQAASSYVRSVESDFSASHERTLNKGRDEIREMVVNLCIGGGDSIINQAHAFYTIAVERNFTRGRRTVQVAAACLYIACRQNSKAYLLIDFSDYLRINVYVLGAVFLMLCQRLRLEEHPIVQKPIDPSLFIHRFTERLLGERNFAVSRTAMRIIASMKRDWMQTGRKPSGLCGAALYISALSHGLKYSKSDVVSVVHICEATLTKRLIEFENTESGSLTIEEFNTKASELERESHSTEPKFQSTKSGIMEVLCEHKDSEAPHFAHGLCKQCYDDFIEISGGLQGGSEPPAFQRAEKQRMSKASPEEMAEEPSLNTPAASRENGHIHNEKEMGSAATAKLSKKKSCSTAKADEIENQSVPSKEPENLGTTTGHPSVDEASNPSHEPQDTSGIAGNESESLSDIDDAEVSGYLHNEEEARYKKIIWEEMNKEYLEEQAAKEAAAAAAKEAYEANMKNCSGDMLAYQELAAAAAAAVAKSRKERKQKRAEEARNSTPAQTAAEATRQMLTKKRLSSKINYDVLEKLFDDSTPESEKKQRTKSDLGIDANREVAEDHAFGSEAVDANEYDGNNEFGEEDGTEDAYNDYPYYGNQDETYDYNEGYDSDY